MKYAVLLIAFLCSCGQVKEKTQQPDLIGKTIAYTYGEHVYHLTIETDSTLYWEAKTGSEKGLKGEETYILEWIAHQKLFITWGEKEGPGVSQVLDFEKNKVYNHLLFGRKVNKSEGKIKFIE